MRWPMVKQILGLAGELGAALLGWMVWHPASGLALESLADPAAEPGAPSLLAGWGHRRTAA